jgi:cytochrome oxidase Cu insertion factor (SCO1/SenC/PrrC family)
MSIKICILLLSLVCVFTAINSANLSSAQSRVKTEQKTNRYACPMHPEVTSSKPGKCPKCGMHLRLKPEASEEPVASGANATPKDPADPFRFSSSRIPDAKVVDQNGKELNFYTDLVKHKTVAINFIFTTCTTICPPLTATFRRVQQDLGESIPDVQLISVSVDPGTDTPERLRDFAAKFKAAPGWTFVTGEESQINSLLEAFGVAVANKNDHTPMVLIGNDKVGFWTRTYGLSSPSALVKAITEAANHK